MSFAGWTLAQLLPLFAVGAAAITGLYLLRMRRREVVVPFAALWERVSRESESRRIWRRLRRLASWLIQILILLLVCFALGDPRPEVWLRDPRTVAVVIDRSASMAGAGDEDGSQRIDAARALARAEVEALGPLDRAVVIAAGEEVTVAAPLSGDASVLLPAIEGIEPTHGEADLARGLALASHAVGDHPGARIVVVTDGALDRGALGAVERCQAGPVPCAVRTVSGPHENLAITAFAARRYPEQRDQVEVLTEVRNLGDAPAVAVLEIEAGGVNVGRRRLELGPGEVRREVLSELEAARSVFTAQLVPVDEPPPSASAALGPAFDDRAWAVVPPLAPLDVTLVTDGTNLFLEAALLTLGEHVRLFGMSVGEAREDPMAAKLTEADLVFFDAGAEPLPARLPPTHVVLFDPWRHGAAPSPIAKKADVTRPFLTEQARKHPILEDVVLKDVNIARGTTFVTEPGDTVLVRSLGEPVVALREAEQVTLAFGFDPRQSDLALRTAFPLLVANVVQYVEQRTPGFVAAAPLGQSPALALADLGLEPSGVTRVEVQPPDGPAVVVPVEDGALRLRALVPGIYGLTAADGPVRGSRVEVAVNQTSVEASDLHGRLPGEASPSGEATPAEAPPADDPGSRGQGPLWTLLVLAAASILALEWATYHRRITV